MRPVSAAPESLRGVPSGVRGFFRSRVWKTLSPAVQGSPRSRLRSGQAAKALGARSAASFAESEPERAGEEIFFDTDRQDRQKRGLFFPLMP